MGDLRYVLIVSAISGLRTTYDYYAATKKMRRDIERTRTLAAFWAI